MMRISLRNTQIVLHTRWKKKCGEKCHESFLRQKQTGPRDFCWTIIWHFSRPTERHVAYTLGGSRMLCKVSRIISVVGSKSLNFLGQPILKQK